MGLLRPNRGSKQTIFNFNRKKVPLNLVVQTKPLTFALANKQKRQLSFVRRDGRVVEYTGLENRRTARYRGFESLSLRNRVLQTNGLQDFFIIILACPSKEIQTLLLQ